MKIIKTGHTGFADEKLFECGKCNTQFIAHYRDKRFDFRDGDYVKCPICGEYIDWNIGIKQSK